MPAFPPEIPDDASVSDTSVLSSHPIEFPEGTTMLRGNFERFHTHPYVVYQDNQQKERQSRFRYRFGKFLGRLKLGLDLIEKNSEARALRYGKKKAPADTEDTTIDWSAFHRIPTWSGESSRMQSTRRTLERLHVVPKPVHRDTERGEHTYRHQTTMDNEMTEARLRQSVNDRLTALITDTAMRDGLGALGRSEVSGIVRSFLGIMEKERSHMVICQARSSHVGRQFVLLGDSDLYSQSLDPTTLAGVGVLLQRGFEPVQKADHHDDCYNSTWPMGPLHNLSSAKLILPALTFVSNDDSRDSLHIDQTILSGAMDLCRESKLSNAQREAMKRVRHLLPPGHDRILYMSADCERLKRLCLSNGFNQTGVVRENIGGDAVAHGEEVSTDWVKTFASDTTM